MSHFPEKNIFAEYIFTEMKIGKKVEVCDGQ